MTGNYDGNRVGAVGQPHRSGSLRISDATRQFLVRNGFSIRDPAQLVPDLDLERRPLGCQGLLETLEFSREIGVEFVNQG